MRTTTSTGLHRKSGRTKTRIDDRVVLAIIMGGTVLVLSLILLNNWAISRPPNATAPSVAATNVAIDSADLLPLAAPVNPIVGGHDMNNLPDPGRRGNVMTGIAQANVDLPLMQWDWGTIPAIPAVAQTFPIQNTGDKSLLINNVVTSCGCTIAALSSSVIPPGERADLKVTFDPNFHATQGPVTRLVWLETNDPDMPVVELRMDANVIP